jgi:hypothetical protein
VDAFPALIAAPNESVSCAGGAAKMRPAANIPITIQLFMRII